MVEAHLELRTLRCPRCGGDVVLRVLADDRGKSVILTIDTACVSCGVSPWKESDERSVVFTPGVSPDDNTAQAHIEALQRRCEALQNSLAAAQRNLERANPTESELRGEISRLEGALAQARAEVRKIEEATRGSVAPGKRPIEME